MKIQIPEVNLKKKNKKNTSFECYFFSARVACALLITPCTELKVDGPRGTLGQCALAHLEQVFLAVGILI